MSTQARAAPDDEADADPAAAEVERRRAIVGADLHGQRLDRVLVGLAPEFSRSHLQSLIERGCVRIDAAACTHVARRVKAGQAIEVDLEPTAEALAFRPEPIALDVCFEDEHLLVIDKPAGLVVHPAAGHWGGTLLNALLAHHEGAARLPRAGIVHRLDKDTSGLMVVAKTPAGHAALVRAIAGREVRREYRALAWGEVAPEPLSIEAPIGRDPRSRLRMAVVAGGRSARTDVLRIACRDSISALQCRLHTGRTHQIRVHLASRGHPLVADALYGGKPALGLVRQALHAWRLSFDHPRNGRALEFTREPPADLAAAWAAVVGR